MPYTTTDHDEDLFVSEQPSVLLSSADVRVSAVIPARNEAKNLAYVFGRLPAGLHEVILVNGRSTDKARASTRTAHAPGLDESGGID